MAERRMFAKTIIDSDAFIDMPTSARLLYYDLAMRADDDGFINSPKKVCRMTGANDNDLKVLETKKFIIPFESGVVVIKHWLIHNYIRRDTYQSTKYKNEMRMLRLDENKAYTQVHPSTARGRLVDGSSTQDRLGKDRIGKDRLDISYSSNEEYSSTQNVDKPALESKNFSPSETKKENQMSDERVQKVVSMYHEICKSLPRIEKVTDSRRVLIRKAEERLKGTGGFGPFFERVERSDFLTGRKTNWRAGFDWIMKAANLWKIIEGNYDNRKDPSNPDYTDQTRYENLEL